MQNKTKLYYGLLEIIDKQEETIEKQNELLQQEKYLY